MVLAACVAAASAACDNLGIPGEPSEISVVIEGSSVDRAYLITSSDWIYIQNPSCETGEECPPSVRVLAADTTVIDPPFQGTFRFTSTLRYLVETFPVDSVSATMSMSVKVDGRDWYEEERLLAPVGPDGERESLQFIYWFNEPVIR